MSTSTPNHAEMMALMVKDIEAQLRTVSVVEQQMVLYAVNECLERPTHLQETFDDALKALIENPRSNTHLPKGDSA